MFAKVLALRAGAVGPDQHAVPPRFSHCLHHQLVEILQHMVTLHRVVEQIRFYVIQHRIFIEIVLDDFGHVRVQGFVVGHARAEGVGQSYVPRAIGVE